MHIFITRGDYFTFSCSAFYVSGEIQALLRDFNLRRLLLKIVAATSLHVLDSKARTIVNSRHACHSSFSKNLPSGSKGVLCLFGLHVRRIIDLTVICLCDSINFVSIFFRLKRNTPSVICRYDRLSGGLTKVSAYLMVSGLP